MTLLVGVLGALSLAGSASAASKCGKQVLADWFDNGRIDRIYPLHCYNDAIALIPADIAEYADAHDVIERALQYARRGKLDPTIYPDPTPGGGDAFKNPNGGTEPPHGIEEGQPDNGGQTEASGPVNTSGPSSLPVPLLVLGGMSLALLAAGGFGYWSRRRQAAEGGDDDDSPGDDHQI